VVLLGAFLCPLWAQGDTRSREEMIKVCHAKVEKVKEGMHRWASEGGNLKCMNILRIVIEQG